MKRITFKFIVCFALACAVAVCAASFTACGVSAKDYYGEYHYANPWSAEEPDYGIKVKVQVKPDTKGDRIVSVKIIESNYAEVTDDWNGKNVWLDGLNDLLKSYGGKYVADVLAAKVTVKENGEPQSVSDGDLMITGATQGCGRLLLAVQNALR